MRKTRKRKKKTIPRMKQSFSDLDKTELAFIRACSFMKRTTNQYHV